MLMKSFVFSQCFFFPRSEACLTRRSLQLRLYGGVRPHYWKIDPSAALAGLSINKHRPIVRLCTTKHEPKLTKLQQVLFNLTKTTHSQIKLLPMETSLEVLCIRIMTHPQVLGRNLHSFTGFWASKTHPF